IQRLFCHRSALHLFNHLVRQVLRNRSVVREGQRRRRTARRDRTKVGNVTEQLRQRNIRLDHLRTCTGVDTLHKTATTVQVAGNGTRVLVGRHDLDRHNGLQQLGTTLLRRLLEAQPRCQFERQRVGVHIVERPMEQPYLHRVYRVASQRSVHHRRLKALLYGGDVFLGNDTTYNVVHKLQAVLVVVTGTEFKHDVRKLTATTRLLLVYFLVLHRSRKGLLISHLWRTLVDLNLKLALQPVDDNLQVKLTHTTKNGLTRLLVGMNPQRGVFFDQLRNRHTQLVDIRLLLGLNSVADNRVREYHRLEHYLALFIAQRIAGLDVFKAHHGADITGRKPIDLVLLVGVHLEHTRNTLLLSGARIVYVRARLKDTGIRPDKTEPSYEGVSRDLEGQRHKGLVFARADHDILISVGGLGDNIILVQRRRQHLHHDVKHGLNALILK